MSGRNRPGTTSAFPSLSKISARFGAVGAKQLCVPGKVVRPVSRKAALTFCPQRTSQPREEAGVIGAIKRFYFVGPKRHEFGEVAGTHVAGVSGFALGRLLFGVDAARGGDDSAA